MRILLWGGMILLIGSLLFTASCAPYQASRSKTRGAMAGTGGIVLDHSNSWRGGIIGNTLGALSGATISEVSDHGARQAAIAERPVLYTTKEGRGTYYAVPVGRNARTNCKKVRERIYENERLVSDRNKEVCTGGK